MKLLFVQDPHLSYKWCEELGVGRFAKCCMVRQRRSGRLLACKQIDKRSAGTDRARILREVEMLGTLGDHPNIAREYHFRTESVCLCHMPQSLMLKGSIPDFSSTYSKFFPLHGRLIE